MTPPLALVLGPAAAAAELRTPAARAQVPTAEEVIAAAQPIEEEPIAEASHIAEATPIAERRFEGEPLRPAPIMGVAAVTTAATAIQTINIAVEAATTAAFIPAAPSIEVAPIVVAPCIEVAPSTEAAELIVAPQYGAVARVALMLPTAAEVVAAGGRFSDPRKTARRSNCAQRKPSTPSGGLAWRVILFGSGWQWSVSHSA